MNQKSIDARIKAIADLQKGFDARVESTESSLLIRILSDFETMRKNLFPTFKKVWNKFFVEEYVPLIESFASDVKEIVKLNEAYFGEAVPTTQLYERLGLSAEGAIAKEGYVSTILQDQTAKREVQQYIHRTKQLKFDQKVKQDLTKLVKGEPNKPGVIKKFTDQNVTTTYNEADRVIQQEYADTNGMNAGMYTGGLIDSSRPFCEARNRKVFLREEIALFGTSEDKFGGYSDKAAGLFNGKPKTGYDPFTQCGGYNCRHHWSWLADEYAVRVEKDLIIENGKLKRK